MLRKTHKSFFGIAGFLILFALFSCGSSKKTSGSKNHHDNSDKVSSAFIRKYSEILGFELDKKCNKELIEEVSSWIGTKYKSGGASKSGTDCSGFVSSVYKLVYNRSINRSSGEIYKQCKEVSRNNLREGDILFFKIKSKNINHVGLYLKDGYFIHSSTSKGVIVNKLTEEYYEKYYFAGGRLP